MSVLRCNAVSPYLEVLRKKKTHTSQRLLLMLECFSCVRGIQLGSLTYIYKQTIPTCFYHCIHNNVISRRPHPKFGQLKPFTKHSKVEQQLNLNPGQEVGLYLFPAPILFLPRDRSLDIVHPDNGAALGIVALFCPGCAVILLT